jgi:hypothetical protein
MSRYKECTSRKSLMTPEVSIQEPKEVHSSFGKVPEYIRRFGLEKKRAEEEVLRQRELAKIPKGCRFMTDEERQNSIADVVRNRASLTEELKRLPLTNTTLKQRRRKLEIELKLSEMDKLFDKLHSNKVLIRVDETPASL